jgi:hypothetical protein
MYTYMTARYLGYTHCRKLLQEAQERRTFKVGLSWLKTLRKRMDHIRLALVHIDKRIPNRAMASSHRVL